MDILKIGILGIAGVLLAVLFKAHKAEYSTFISMAVCVCIFVYIITKVQIICAYVNSLQSMLPVDGSYVEMILKMIGITYVSEFSVSLCKDAGYASIAGQIEMFAKISILIISMPVLMTFVETLEKFL